MPSMKDAMIGLTPKDLWDLGWEIVKDEDTDYYCFRSRFFVEESGLCDTPEEAISSCRWYLGA